MAPTRILIQTKTHLVPGADYHDKCKGLKNGICRAVWQRDFDSTQDRWHSHGAYFGYHNRRCFFLLDHGVSNKVEQVPVLWYRWTGDQFEKIPSSLPAAIRTELDKYPFTEQPSSPRRAKIVLSECTNEYRLELIAARLRHLLKPTRGDIEFLSQNPDLIDQLREAAPHFQAQIDELAGTLRAAEAAARATAMPEVDIPTPLSDSGMTVSSVAAG
ncbi:hypothetical protein SODALDRAFT_319694 [Sodiomyces alkalinus F11]|uniref:Uncharacterized protein n=1 Tax=Sodiomyces alkalinus (strain CBS 110278 / VKM F-3762 / F11) TaxID=1314773 RepID=A0A3N2Q8S5_SODAK|nr:hypothetical protein SODALDRAFT_319694 [Sodiomyces alkalinus F11]ROT43181.1 hypothetical protein SODALDRAFT_319694 [Sodiomyces alkalinus F11]